VTGKVSTIVFAIVLIGWGILGLASGDFAPGWQPVPESMPFRQALAYLTAVVCVAVGVGLLVKRASAVAARAFFFWLMAWLLLLRLPWMLVDFGVGTWWSASSTAVITATAWVVYISLAGDWDRNHLGFLSGNSGLRLARTLFGLGLVPIGLAHFRYVEATAPLVPLWLLWPVFWAYFTGAAFIAAGIAIVVGIFARLAAALVTLQIGLFTLMIWVPRAFEGNLTPFQWGEFVVSIILTVCGWVVTESYRDMPWFTARINNHQELK
jgi:uncharacterized membrane protein